MKLLEKLASGFEGPTGWGLFFREREFLILPQRSTVCAPQCGKMKKLPSLKKKIRQNNYLVHNFISKTVTFTKFLPKMRESKFPYIIFTLCAQYVHT